MSYELQLATINHANMIDRNHIEEIRDECESNRDDLNEDIENLEFEKLDLESELDDLEAGSSEHEMCTSKIVRLENKIAEKREESDKWNDDYKHLEDVLTSGDTDFICEYHIDNYLRETFEECNTIPDYLQSYIDWGKLVSDNKMDYSAVDIDGAEYWYR